MRSTLFLMGTLVFIAGSLFGVSAQASEDRIFHYVEEVASPVGIENYAPGGRHWQPLSPQLPPREVSLDKIINLGERVWKFIVDNQPVLNVSYRYANALPTGVRDGFELENFSDIQTRSFRLYGDNWYGSRVYDVTYTVMHRYNGSYQGRGRYLEHVTVVPSNISVSWGYTMNFGVRSVTPVNQGSKDAPIAGMMMELDFAVSTVMKKFEARPVFEFRGDRAAVRVIER